jgi:hypothetical protein
MQTPLRRHETVEISSAGGATDPLVVVFGHLNPGDPILVVRYENNKPLLALAVKESDSGPLAAREGDLLVSIPVRRYVVEGHGQITVVETYLCLNFDAQPTSVMLGEASIREWIFPGCATIADPAAIEANKDLIMRLIRLAAKIGFGFQQFPELSRVASVATNVAVRRLAKIFNLGLANPETINQAMTIAGELAELGLSDEGIIRCILHLREQEVRDLMKIIAVSH